MKKGTLLALLVAVSALMLFNCALPDLTVFDPTERGEGTAAGGYVAIEKSESIVTLAWDPPLVNPESYRVYYQVHGTDPIDWIFGWIPVPPDATEIEIDMTALGPGEYDFAVAAVDSEGVESGVHSSLDNSADPDSGWYLSWGD